MSRSCKECFHNNPNDPSDLAYACLNCSWPTFAGEPTNFKPKPITNADRIRAMTDEELASFITSDLCELLCGSPLSCDGDCEKKMLDWLRQEVEE